MKKGFFVCLFCAFAGLVGLASGPGTFWDVPMVYPWADIGITFVGFCGCIYWFWQMRLQKDKHEKVMSDEEYAQARAELDAMYYKEHGELPKEPEAEETQKHGE